MNDGGIIQSASDSVEQVFGWKPRELYGRNVKILIPEPRRSALDRYLDRYRRADRTPSLQRSRRFDAIRKDGKVIQIELSVSRADLPAYGTPYFIGIIRDVTNQIEQGPDSVDDRTKLQALITEQTRALATANLRLQLADRLASLGTLAAGLGHDMNNVLLPVRAHLNAIEHAGLTSAAVVHVKAVRRSIAYLQHLSDGLHFLALDPDGPGIADDGEGDTNLSQWWSQVGALLRKAVPTHVVLKVVLDPSLPAVRIAPHWLTQAMLNLIVNAGEAIPLGKKLKGTVQVRATLSDDTRSVRVSVTDNGRGMTQVIRRRAMDMFFTTKRRAMGTGLGLPLVRKVAERAGGNVEITSQPTRGTTVTLLLPVGTGNTDPDDSMRDRRVQATVCIEDPRTAALVSQVLISARIGVVIGKWGIPGPTALWVTDPSPKALAAATKLQRLEHKPTIVLIGYDGRSRSRQWKDLGAIVVDPRGGFAALRIAMANAMREAAAVEDRKDRS